MSDPDENVDVPHIHIGEPFYRLLTYRMHVKLPLAMTVFYLVNVIRVIVIPILHHAQIGSHFFQAAEIRDYQAWVVAFICQPLIFYVYWVSVKRIPEVFEQMAQNNAVRPRGSTTVGDFLRDLEVRLAGPRLSAMVLIAVIITLVIYYLISSRIPHPQIYPYTDFQRYGIETIYKMFQLWFLYWALVRGAVLVQALREFWTQDFVARVHPFHSDGGGGLGPVSEISRENGLLTGAVGLFLASTVMATLVNANTATPYDIGTLIALAITTLIIAPLAFFFPLWSTHRAMLEARDEQLDLLSERYYTIWQHVEEGSTALDEGRVKQVRELVSLYDDLMGHFPTWPHDWTDVRRFALGLAPLAGFLLSALVQVLSSGNSLSNILGH